NIWKLEKMAFLCEEINTQTNECLRWVEHSFVPTLTTADRDTMILWAVGIFAIVFVAKQIQRLL
ncbi:hypothetical protein, partial [Acinetobacter guillouiae]